jgi:signal transduction histidine kinase
VVSDPHWFKESLLCLLSNATKYSSGAPVTVAVDLVMFCRLPKPRGGMALAPATLSHFHSQGRFSVTPNVAADGVPAIALARFNSQGTVAGLPSFTPSAAVDGVPASAPASNKGFLDGPGRRGSYGRGHGHVLGPTDRQSDSTRPAAPTPHPHPPPLARHPAPAPRALFLMVTVEDEGIGIELDKRTELFQPFKQAQRLTGGTGLGLYSLSKVRT